MKSFYRCKRDNCPVRLTLDRESDIITEIWGAHSHQNELLNSLVSTKVAEARMKALEGAYSKPRVVYGQLMASLQADPGTSMGFGKIHDL